VTSWRRIVDDAVDPESRILEVEPDAGEFKPQDYDWWSPG
jgi:hypothetical protein